MDNPDFCSAIAFAGIEDGSLAISGDFSMKRANSSTTGVVEAPEPFGAWGGVLSAHHPKAETDTIAQMTTPFI